MASPATIPQLPRGLHAPTQRGFSARLIGDVVVDLGFAERDVVEDAVRRARESGRQTGRLLVEDGILTPEQHARVIAERFGLDHVDLDEFTVDPVAVGLVPLEIARRDEAVPIAFADERTLLVAMAEPSNVLAVEDISLVTGRAVRPAIVAPEELAQLLRRMASEEDAFVVDATAEELEDPFDPAAGGDMELGADDGEQPAVRLVHSVLHQAIERGASDIHFAPEEGELVGHFRIDGVLVPAVTVPRAMVGRVVSRLKVMAELDISERRAPQDGRMRVSVDGRKVDLRVVTLPLVGGESVVLRIMDRGGEQQTLPALGMPDGERERMVAALRRTHGAVLVTGPTGSGKTSTLYAALGTIDGAQRSVLTIEDPVEVELAGVRQVQVNARVGMGFASGLRAMLRADPDVVMVGEIRDAETAKTAIEAALTGHLVLSTLHTNDAPGAITRLIEMGVEPFLVASAVRCVVAQRLVRRLCVHCRRPVRLEAAALRRAGWQVAEDLDAYEAVGCTRCGGSGYRGRIGLYEVLDVGEELHELILSRPSGPELAAAAERAGMRRLHDAGLEQVRAGVTSASEALRVLGGRA